MARIISQEMNKKYSDRFDKQILKEVKCGVVQKRKWTDIVCFIIFIIIILIYIIFTIIFWANGAIDIGSLNDKNSVKSKTSSFGGAFAKNAGIIIGMIALSIVLSIIFVFLCSKFPKVMVITAIITTFAMYLIIIITGFIMKVWILSVIMIIVALVNGCMLWCFRDMIKVGIVLLGVSGKFMQEKPKSVSIGAIAMLINIVLVIVFITGWLSVYAQTLPQNNNSQSSRDKFTGMMFGYIFMTIYIAYFLYYLMVFVLSTAVAYWYYQQEKNVLYGYKIAYKNIGTFAFAAAVITFITILRRAAQNQMNSQNGVMKAIWCCLACILKCIEGFVEVLNHNAIIVMSVTCENYINSAKTAIGLITNNFGLFYVVDFITDFIHFYSVVFCVLIPSLIGGGLIWNSQQNGNVSAVGGFVIFLLSWIVVSVILGTFYEALSAIFIMYCFDKRLRQQGVTIGNIPSQIKQILYKAGCGQRDFDIIHKKQSYDKPNTQTQLRKQSKNPSIQKDPHAYQYKSPYYNNQSNSLQKSQKLQKPATNHSKRKRLTNRKSQTSQNQSNDSQISQPKPQERLQQKYQLPKYQANKIKYQAPIQMKNKAVPSVTMTNNNYNKKQYNSDTSDKISEDEIREHHYIQDNINNQIERPVNAMNVFENNDNNNSNKNFNKYQTNKQAQFPKYQIDQSPKKDYTFQKPKYQQQPVRQQSEIQPVSQQNYQIQPKPLYEMQPVHQYIPSPPKNTQMPQATGSQKLHPFYQMQLEQNNNFNNGNK